MAAPVLGLVGLLPIVVRSVLAIVFGLIAGRDIRRSDGRLTGSGQALTGWILGITGLALFGILAAIGLTVEDDDEIVSSAQSTAPTSDVVATEPARGTGDLGTTEPAVSETVDDPGDEVSFAELDVGMCVNVLDVTDDVLFGLPVVDCRVPHDGEVFYIDELSGGADEAYPGDDAVFAELDAVCAGSAFSDYVGVAYEASVLDITYYYPTSESWAVGDRTFHCVAISVDG